MRGTLLSFSSNRSVVVVLGAMVLALGLVVLASALAPKKADAATQVVTKTFHKPATILIPASANLADCGDGRTQGVADPYPSQRIIQAFNQGTILDVNLVLRGFQHTHPADVDVRLSRGLLNRTVMSDVGSGDNVNLITLTLDDEAANALPDEDQLTSGRFKPNNFEDEHPEGDVFPQVASTNPNSALSGFDGFNPNGTWQLRVRDDEGSDCGQLAQGWSLIIKARVQTT